MPGGTAAVVAPQQPQTTVEPPGGPFIRHSEPGKRRLFDLTSNAFGALINQPIKALPGWTRRYRWEFIATGGANSTSTNSVAAAADSPENCVSLLTVRDALGTPIVSGPGYEMLRLVPMLSGGFGEGNMHDTHNLPSFSAIPTGTNTTATGNFTFSTCTPFEFGAGAYGVIGQADNSEVPDVSIQLASAATVFTTAPTANPTIEVKLGADFYWLPQGEDVEPPGIGSTRQWFLKAANPTIPSASTETVQLPRQGGWLDTLILILRDSTNARVDGWPSIMRVAIDGIGLIDATLDEVKDDMALMWGYGGGFTRPTGVIAFSRRIDMTGAVHGLFTTLNLAIPTSPGTLIEIEGAPWGTISNSPGSLSVVQGMIIPSEALIQGLETT